MKNEGYQPFQVVLLPDGVLGFIRSLNGQTADVEIQASTCVTHRREELINLKPGSEDQVLLLMTANFSRNPCDMIRVGFFGGYTERFLAMMDPAIISSRLWLINNNIPHCTSPQEKEMVLVFLAACASHGIERRHEE